MRVLEQLARESVNLSSGIFTAHLAHPWTRCSSSSASLACSSNLHYGLPQWNLPVFHFLKDLGLNRKEIQKCNNDNKKKLNIYPFGPFQDTIKVYFLTSMYFSFVIKGYRGLVQQGLTVNKLKIYKSNWLSSMAKDLNVNYILAFY